jgi:hypothetical protein
MRKISPLHLLLLPMMMALCLLSSCSSSEGIDNYFTFNLNKNFSITAPAGSAVWPPVSMPVTLLIDSTDLASNGTSLALIKSVELTKLTFTSSSASFPFTDVDTLALSASDSAGTQLIANFNGAIDSMYLSNADIARFMKNPKANFSATIGYKKVPPEATTFTANYTLVLTAKPLP